MPKVLNLRRVDEALMYEIKLVAYDKGMTLREFVLRSLAEKIGKPWKEVKKKKWKGYRKIKRIRQEMPGQVEVVKAKEAPLLPVEGQVCWCGKAAGACEHEIPLTETGNSGNLQS